MVVHTLMNHLIKLAGPVALLAALPFATGCAMRAAPFDQMDRAQITVLRLSQQQAPATPQAQPGSLIPGLPGIPPELGAMGQQAAQALQNVLPGMIPQSILPGAP